MKKLFIFYLFFTGIAFAVDADDVNSAGSAGDFLREQAFAVPVDPFETTCAFVTLASHPAQERSILGAGASIYLTDNYTFFVNGAAAVSSPKYFIAGSYGFQARHPFPRSENLAFESAVTAFHSRAPGFKNKLLTVSETARFPLKFLNVGTGVDLNYETGQVFSSAGDYEAESFYLSGRLAASVLNYTVQVSANRSALELRIIWGLL